MAKKKSAQKRAKQSEVKRVRNNARRSSIKTIVKKMLTSIEDGAHVGEVTQLFNDAQAKIARAAGKGVLHKNTASRKISRLALKVAAVAAAAK